MHPDSEQTDEGQDIQSEEERLADAAEKKASEQENKVGGIFSVEDMLAAFKHGLEYEYFDTGGMDANLPEKNQPFYDWLSNYRSR